CIVIDAFASHLTGSEVREDHARRGPPVREPSWFEADSWDGKGRSVPRRPHHYEPCLMAAYGASARTHRPTRTERRTTVLQHTRGRSPRSPSSTMTRMATLVALFLTEMGTVGAEEPGRTTLSVPSIRYTVPEKPYVILARGEVEAIVVDNRAVDDD